MYEKNWTAIIDFSKSATQTSVVKYDASNLPALAIPIESKLEYCTDVADCVWTTSNITLILN
jgi:Tfp pilus assembly ATPase PilU